MFALERPAVDDVCEGAEPINELLNVIYPKRVACSRDLARCDNVSKVVVAITANLLVPRSIELSGTVDVAFEVRERSSSM